MGEDKILKGCAKKMHLNTVFYYYTRRHGRCVWPKHPNVSQNQRVASVT